jgi:hypothetical protein
MKAPPIPRPDDATMRAVYAREAPHRPHWPRTYAEAAADPLIAQILRLMAAHPPMFGRRRAPVQAPQSRTWIAAQKPAPREIDFKSRAAGEKPEPDDSLDQ